MARRLAFLSPPMWTPCVFSRPRIQAVPPLLVQLSSLSTPDLVLRSPLDNPVQDVYLSTLLHLLCSLPIRP